MIVLDTPGGLGSSMREIVKRCLALEGAGVVYVAPPGSSADSAGAVIARRRTSLAMAPQTNIGSSTPISLGGEDISKDLRRKIVNDAAAYVGELAASTTATSTAAEAMVTRGRELRRARGAGDRTRRRHRADAPRAARARSTARRPSRRASSSTPRARRSSDVEMSFWQRALDLLDRPEHHRADALARPHRDRRRALEPGPDLPGHGRRDLADPRPLRAPGAPGLARPGCC